MTTLKKYFREELGRGIEEANLQVAQAAFNQAIGRRWVTLPDGTEKLERCDPVPSMTIWWTKTRMGWREPPIVHEHTDNPLADATKRNSKPGWMNSAGAGPTWDRGALSGPRPQKLTRPTMPERVPAMYLGLARQFRERARVSCCACATMRAATSTPICGVAGMWQRMHITLQSGEKTLATRTYLPPQPRVVSAGAISQGPAHPGAGPTGR